jgi:hypothetical protein
VFHDFLSVLPILGVKSCHEQNSIRSLAFKMQPFVFVEKNPSAVKLDRMIQFEITIKWDKRSENLFKEKWLFYDAWFVIFAEYNDFECDL